jgi:hypothetical protein
MDDNIEESSPAAPCESGGEVGTNREEHGDEVKAEDEDEEENSPGEQV